MEDKEAEHGEGTRQRNCKHGRIGATIYRLSMVDPYHRLACASSLIYQSAALATRERRQPVAANLSLFVTCFDSGLGSDRFGPPLMIACSLMPLGRGHVSVRLCLVGHGRCRSSHSDGNNRRGGFFAN
jgi:hypothetical protein